MNKEPEGIEGNWEEIKERKKEKRIGTQTKQGNKEGAGRGGGVKVNSPTPLFVNL